MLSGFMLVALLLVIVGIVSLVQLKAVTESAAVILHEQMPVSDAVMEAKTEIIKARDGLAEYMLEVDLNKLGKIQNEFEQTHEKIR